MSIFSRVQNLKIHLIAHYSNATSLWKGVPALRSHVQNMMLQSWDKLLSARIELKIWNRIVHQNALGVCSSLQPGHDTNKFPRRMQVSPPAEERWQVANLKAETFEDLWYLFSSEDKYKGFSLYQREDWLIDWNQLQLCQF